MRQALTMGICSVFLAMWLPACLLLPLEETTQCPVMLIIENEKSMSNDVSLVLQHKGVQEEIMLEEYLIGVVVSEMPSSFEMEAIKAQAVAARTFALSNQKHDDFDLCSDSACCQAWHSKEELKDKLGESADACWEKARTAVQETRGLVLAYEGMLINAVYFSCAGGTTEDAVEVWGSSVPYLKSVPSSGEENAPRYQSLVSISIQETKEIFEREFENLTLPDDPETWFENMERTQGGGVRTLHIGGISIPGTRLRNLFGLNSTLFSVNLSDNTFQFEVKGFGHRVGMSQYGANAMAKEGKTFREILLHYYPGVSINEKAP